MSNCYLSFQIVHEKQVKAIFDHYLYSRQSLGFRYHLRRPYTAAVCQRDQFSSYRDGRVNLFRNKSMAWSEPVRNVTDLSLITRKRNIKIYSENNLNMKQTRSCSYFSDQQILDKKVSDFLKRLDEFIVKNQ